MSRPFLSRRDFLKLGGYSLMGLAFPNLPTSLLQLDDFSNLQGRVIDRTIWSYDAPDFKSARRKLYWHDLVLPIQNTAIGDDESAYNRVWYELEEGGYDYSGSIQPVRTLLNQPGQISLKGALCEVSVPFTDARTGPELAAEVVYRLYYETVHWVKASRGSWPPPSPTRRFSPFP